MSQSDVDSVRASIEAYNRGDFDAALTYFHPEVEWRLPPNVPDFRIIRGHSGVRRFWKTGATLFGDLRLEPVEVIEREGLVLGRWRLVGRGLRSGLLTDREIHAVAEFRDGLVIRLLYFFSKDEALKAAGLSE